MNEKSIKVFLIEDNPGDARLFKEYLKEAGYIRVEVEHLDRLETALARLALDKPNLILLDLGLPDSQGLETFTQVHAQAPEIPIVVLSGLDDANRAVEAVGAGAQDYLVKGEISPGQLERAIRYAIERKQAEEKTNYQAFLLEHVNDAIIGSDPDTRLIAWNKAAERMYGWKEEEVLGLKTGEVMRTEWAEGDISEMLKEIEAQGHWKGEVTHALKDGGRIPVEISTTVLRDAKGKLTGYVSVARDITERKQVEDALRVSEERFKLLFDKAPLGYQSLDAEGKFITINQSWLDTFGYQRDEVVGRWFGDFLAPEYVEAFRQRFPIFKAAGQIHSEFEMLHQNGSRHFIAFEGRVGQLPNGDFLQTHCILQDITERKQAEDALHKSETALKKAQNVAHVGSWVWHVQNNRLEWSDEMYHVFGIEKEKFSGDLSEVVAHAIHPDDREAVDASNRSVAEAGQPIPLEYRVIWPDGTVRWVWAEAGELVRNADGTPGILSGIVQDITERKMAEEKIKRQVEHLQALSSIDRLIASNFNLKLSLSEILNYVTQELDVDAADILILNPFSLMLEFGAERGFHTQAIRKAQVRLGESYAGRAAQERRLVQIPDLRNETDKAFLSTHLAGEGFVCYYGVPLVAKGQVKGVLEVFHRTVLNPGTEWLGFLETLAGQAAIAIDNNQLFENLQSSNFNLAVAYNETIEGWSRAMDLRDEETEGHTRRVSELTLRLANSMGVNPTELVNIRRGALLHDIGKMGVPDHILRKPGALTDEEWVSMRKHPQFAYEMLLPISYLRPALDIPYCHHEKWDGSGYPRGLKGEEIPLAARIFALADVWDALTSDRPYRKAWPREKALEYVLEQSGKHFEPGLVSIFLKEVVNF